MQPIAAPLLQWFDANKRLLPFRQEPSAYHIWVSEIMLQQTRVSAALPITSVLWPNCRTPPPLPPATRTSWRQAVAGAGVLQPGGQHAKAAQIVCRQYGGQLPADYAALRALPGIGDYTAGAIAPLHLASQPRRWTATCCGYLPGWIIALPILPNLPPGASSQPACWKKCPRNAPALITRR